MVFGNSIRATLNYIRGKNSSMKCQHVYVLFTLALCLILLPFASAHAPLAPGNNESLPGATPIPDPAKSWAIYDILHTGKEAHYYRFSIAEGEQIYVSLFISPASRDRGFNPTLVLMGPGFSNQSHVPEYVEIPQEDGVLVKEGGSAAQATYEPFSPSAFYPVTDLDIKAPSSGTYYIAVYEGNQGGQYGLAVGYVESFTLAEWILMPVNLISIYRWEGPDYSFIFGPMAAVVAIGIGFYVLRSRSIRVTLPGWTGILSGLSFLGTGATVLSQMGFALTRAPLDSEVVITLVFAAIPIFLGLSTLLLVRKIAGEIKTRHRVYFAILGLLALFTWSGMLLGPALAMVTSLLRKST